MGGSGPGVERLTGARGLPCPRDARALVRLAGLVAAMLVLAWQSLVVQPHLHLRVAPQQVGAHVSGPQAPSHEPVDCPLCRELAQAGHLVTPGAPAMWVPVAAASGHLMLALQRWVRPVRSHGWHSRGPPTAS